MVFFQSFFIYFQSYFIITKVACRLESTLSVTVSTPTDTKIRNVFDLTKHTMLPNCYVLGIENPQACIKGVLIVTTTMELLLLCRSYKYNEKTPNEVSEGGFHWLHMYFTWLRTNKIHQ